MIAAIYARKSSGVAGIEVRRYWSARHYAPDCVTSAPPIITSMTNERPIFTVFYSWQSDLEGRTNRNLIEGALEKAAKTLRADDSLHVQPVMDRDTAGKSGAPEIAATILGKIDVQFSIAAASASR